MIYSGLSLSQTRKGPRNLFEIERVRDKERRLGWNQWKETEKIVQDREEFEIEDVRALFYIIFSQSDWHMSFIRTI